MNLGGVVEPARGGTPISSTLTTRTLNISILPNAWAHRQACWLHSLCLQLQPGGSKATSIVAYTPPNISINSFSAEDAEIIQIRNTSFQNSFFSQALRTLNNKLPTHPVQRKYHRITWYLIHHHSIFIDHVLLRNNIMHLPRIPVLPFIQEQHNGQRTHNGHRMSNLGNLFWCC